MASPEPSGLAGLLHNRLILGGLGIVAVLLLTAIVLVAIGHGDGESGNAANVAAPSNDDNEGETPAAPIGGLVGTAITTASYRNGPDTRFVILGTIPRGAQVAVVGRSEDLAWLQVRYPPNSNLKGWVDAKMLRVDGNVTVLAIAGPGPVASVDSVTYVPTIAVYDPVEPPTLEPVDIDTPEPDPATAVRSPTRVATPRPTVTPYRTPFPTSTSEPPATEEIPPQKQP